MPGLVGNARREIDERRLAGIEQPLQLGRVDRRDIGLVEFGDDRHPPPRHQSASGKPAVEHIDFGPAHLHQPRPGHHRAHAVVIDQHDAGVARRHIDVGGLHELAARRRARHREMSGLVLLGAAHVEDIERALVGFALETGQRGVVDALDAETLGDLVGERARLGQPLGRGRRQRILAPARQIEPGQLPPHRAVFERHDRVREAGVAQATGRR